MAEETEIWKHYTKYVNAYKKKIRTDIEVSNLGNVIIHKYNFKTKCKIKLDNRGHRCVGGIPIYRMVYLLFVGSIPEGHAVHHKDFNPTNDRVDNLQLMTISKHMKIHAEARGWPKSEKWIEEHKNRMKNLRWINNGIRNRYISKDEPIPDGWYEGMIKRKKGTN